ncbi:MAG: ATP-binding cassette domain-containing protein [Arenicellales bacterium]
MHGFSSCFRLLSAKQKRDYFIVTGLATLSALTDMIGMASIIPVISTLVDYDNSVKKGYLVTLYQFVGQPEKGQFLVILTLCAVALVWISGLTTMLSLFASRRFFKRVNADISARVYRTYMLEPIEKFYAKPSSEFLRNVNGVSERVASGVFGASTIIVSRTVQIVVIIALLLYVNTFVTGVIVAVIGAAYLVIYWGVKPKIVKIAAENFAESKVIQQLAIGSYQGYRGITIDGQLKQFSSRFNALKKEVLRKAANMEIIGAIPRNIIEITGITMLIAASYFIGESSRSSQHFVFVMGLFAVAAYKILPAAQQLYNAFNRITAALVVYIDVKRDWGDLSPSPPSRGDGFDVGNCSVIEVRGLSYSIGAKCILKEISMKIELEGVIRIAGPSGVGKSTFLELLAGLRRPQAGEIFLDEKPMASVNLPSWWSRISYLSQGAYLFEGNLRENIVLSETSVDQERLSKVADICGLQSLGEPNEFDPEFTVAENGSNLSGGQKSRVLLARALYKDTDTVFLDEAFSALDVDAAKAIIEEVQTSFPERCVIVVSHRNAELPGNVTEYVIG